VFDFSTEKLALLPLWFVAFLLALTCHEAAHAWVALRGGDRTAYLGGQVTLNPLPHIQREPFGTILVPFLTYLFAGWMMGWASAPYDPDWERRYPRRAALMSVAGPVANLILAVLALLALRAGLSGGWWELNREATSIAHLIAGVGEQGDMRLAGGRFLIISMVLNSALCIFNLIPFPPLDGYGVLQALVPSAREFYEKVGAGPGSMIGLLVAWMIFDRLFGFVLPLLLLGLTG